MEVVALLQGLIAFLGIPAGIAVSVFSSEEHKSVKNYVGFAKKMSLVASCITYFFIMSVPLAIPLALISILLLFFEISSVIVLPFLAVAIFFSNASQIFASVVFLYCFFIGASMFSPKKSVAEYVRSIATYLPFLAILLLLSVFPF
ncbi:MAG: hypothetical protein AABX51_01100 [Nanoarchaeota archaeon]